MIIEVNKLNIKAAAEVFCASWQASHASFCSGEFISKHDVDYFIRQLSEKLTAGWTVFALDDKGIKGVISLGDNLIEGLYVHPDHQRKGYGAQLLRFAVRLCTDAPNLWILENNRTAELFYRKYGFEPTGRINDSTGRLKEIEYSLSDRSSIL